jgi:hypothetical protein
MKKVLSMALILMFVLSMAGCKTLVKASMDQASSVPASADQASSKQASSEQKSSEQASSAKESAAEKASTDDADVSPEDKLNETYDFATQDLWNDGFCMVSNYVFTGSDADGKTISAQTMDTTLLKLKDTMEKKDEYDSFIQGLKDEKYDKVKEKWQKVSDEAEMVYIGVQAKKLVANDKSPKVNSNQIDLLDQYVDDFTDAVDNLE